MAPGSDELTPGLQGDEALQQSGLADAVVAEDHRPLCRATLRVREAQRLLFGPETADVADREVEQIRREIRAPLLLRLLVAPACFHRLLPFGKYIPICPLHLALSTVYDHPAS